MKGLTYEKRLDVYSLEFRRMNERSFILYLPVSGKSPECLSNLGSLLKYLCSQRIMGSLRLQGMSPLVAVVADGKDRSGMSLVTIKKALAAKGVDVEKRGSKIRFSIKNNVMNGSLKQIKGTGASGSFKITNTDPQEKVGKKVKKAAAKKSPVKKAAAKKSPVKKAAAKKSPAKKAAAKKTSTKNALTAKKTAKGPARKKAAVKKPKSPKKVKAAKKVENPRVKATPKSAEAKKAAPKK
uniref:histone H1-like n=1 Tax=Pristiophorus japonicus TaxID=55135 RepID=UPI00398F21B7